MKYTSTEAKDGEVFSQPATHTLVHRSRDITELNGSSMGAMY